MENRANIRLWLQENHLSYSWLINIMRLKGLEVDKMTLSSVVNGTIKGDRVTKILDMADVVMKDYEDNYLHSLNA